MLSCRFTSCSDNAFLDLALTMRSGCISSDVQLGFTALSQRLVCWGCHAYLPSTPQHEDEASLSPVLTCSAVLFPLVVTVYVTWWFLTFFDNFFSVGYCCKHGLLLCMHRQDMKCIGIDWAAFDIACYCSRYMKLFLASMCLDLVL